MIVLMGKTGSGKTTIVDKLVSKYNFKKLITFTTRPVRQGEKDGVDYHFISENVFQNKINNRFFAEWKSYRTIENIWYYGTSYKDIVNAQKDTIAILTPDGSRELCKENFIDIKKIYINVDENTMIKRLLNRGDDPREIRRRIHQDNIDFQGIENEVDIVFNNNEESNIDDVVSQIFLWVKKEL